MYPTCVSRRRDRPSKITFSKFGERVYKKNRFFGMNLVGLRMATLNEPKLISEVVESSARL